MKNLMLVAGLAFLTSANQFVSAEGKVKNFSIIPISHNDKQELQIKSISDQAIMISAKNTNNNNFALQFDLNKKTCSEFPLDDGNILENIFTPVDKTGKFCILSRQSGSSKAFRFNGQNLTTNPITASSLSAYNDNHYIEFINIGAAAYTVNRCNFMGMRKITTLPYDDVYNTSTINYFPSAQCWVGVKANSIWFLDSEQTFKKFVPNIQLNNIQVCKVSKKGIVYLVGNLNGGKNSLYTLNDGCLEKSDCKINFQSVKNLGHKTLLFEFVQGQNNNCYVISKGMPKMIGDLPISVDSFKSTSKAKKHYPSIIGCDYINYQYYIYTKKLKRFDALSDFLYENYAFDINDELKLNGKNKIIHITLSDNGKKIVGILENTSIVIGNSTITGSIGQSHSKYSIFSFELENEQANETQ